MSRKSTTRFTLSCLTTLSLATPVLAVSFDPPAPVIQPTESDRPTSGETVGTRQALPDGPLRIVVMALSGKSVRLRMPGEAEMREPVVGQEYPEGVTFLTGPRGSVQIAIGPDQIVRIDRLSTVEVIRANFENGKLKTDLGMKYGRVSYDIDPGERQHEAVIHSASSTLAIKGTKVSLYDQPPYTAQAVSLTGRAVFETAKRQRVAFGEKNAKTKSTVNNVQTSPGTAALAQAVVDPSVSFARSPGEQRLIDDLVTRGSVITFNRGNDVPVVRGGTVPTVSDIPGLLPGKLNFVLTWTGDADLNLGVRRIGNDEQFVYPVSGLNVSKDGTGKTLFDHRGGPNGGFEIVYFSKSPENQAYGIGAAHISGAPANATFTAWEDGKQISLIQHDADNTKVFNTPIAKGGTGGTAVFTGLNFANTPAPTKATAKRK